MTRIVSHQDLSTADLIVDAIHEGGVGLPGEPLSKVMPGVGNLGGFRAAGKEKDKKFVVLHTSGEDKEWHDTLDLSTGQFVYYGDNNLGDDPVYAELSLEAKCCRPGMDGVKPVTVGVEDVSRLVSRIRHRQFGILVTTSLFARQAYQGVRGDRHPILFFSGGDTANILVDNGFNTPALVADFLSKEYPVRASDI
jgi:hypothetical protein